MPLAAPRCRPSWCSSPWTLHRLLLRAEHRTRLRTPRFLLRPIRLRCQRAPQVLTLCTAKKYVGGRTGLWQAGTSGGPCCPAASGRTAEGGCRPALENDGHPAGQVAGTPHGRALAKPQLRVPKTMTSSDGYSPSCSAKSLQTPATPSVSLIIHKTSKEAERLACDKGPEFIPGAAPVGTSAAVKAEESEVLTKIKFALSFFFNRHTLSPLFSA